VRRSESGRRSGRGGGLEQQARSPEGPGQRQSLAMQGDSH